MDRPPFVIPSSTGAIDFETGYAIDLPLGPQGYPGWQDDMPQVIARIRKLREDLGIVVEDDEFVSKPMTTNIRHVRKLKRSKKPKPGPKPARRN